MSVSLAPGYDFTTMEEVTGEKLRLWIAGTKNTGEVTGSDVGMVAYDLATTPTWSSCVSEGYLTYDTTRGFITVRTRNGHVPIFGTQGGMFSMRIPQCSNRTLGDSEYFGAGYRVAALRGYDTTDISSTKSLPPASFSAGVCFDNFGVPSDPDHIRDYFSPRWGDVDGGAGVGGLLNSGACKHPHHTQWNSTGARTDPSAASSGSQIHPLYQVGGIQPVNTYINAAASAYSTCRTEAVVTGSRLRPMDTNPDIVPSARIPLSECFGRDLGIAPYMATFDLYSNYANRAHDLF